MWRVGTVEIKEILQHRKGFGLTRARSAEERCRATAPESSRGAGDSTKRCADQWDPCDDAATVQHGPNAKGGRDFVVGDTHGHFATLEHALDIPTFDPARDRLFGVGDLVDRDPRSENAIAWLEEERLKPVRGNHDQRMIGALAYDGGELLRSGPSQSWDASGGNWWYRNRAGDATRWGGRERLAAECDRCLSTGRKVPLACSCPSTGTSRSRKSRPAPRRCLGVSDVHRDNTRARRLS